MTGDPAALLLQAALGAQATLGVAQHPRVSSSCWFDKQERVGWEGASMGTRSDLCGNLQSDLPSVSVLDLMSAGHHPCPHPQSCDMGSRVKGRSAQDACAGEGKRAVFHSQSVIPS